MVDQASELRMLMAERAEHRPASFRTIAVTSGKGGVGKTNIAVNLSLALAETGTRTALLDADWGLSNTEVLLGIAPRRDMRHVLSGECRLADIIQEAPLGLKLIPGASGVAEVANLPTEQRSNLLDELASVADLADVVVLDTSPGIADAVIDLAAGADQVLLLTTPEPTSLTDAYAFAKVLLQRRADAALGLVVNMADNPNHAAQIARGFATVTERFLNRAVPLSGYVCRDTRVTDAVCRQKPFLISHPRSVAASCVRRLAADVMGRPASRQAYTSGLFSSFLRRSLLGGKDAVYTR